MKNEMFCSVVVIELDSAGTEAEGRTLEKLLTKLDNTQHHLYGRIISQRSAFRDRLLTPPC